MLKGEMIRAAETAFQLVTTENEFGAQQQESISSNHDEDHDACEPEAVVTQNDVNALLDGKTDHTNVPHFQILVYATSYLARLV